MAAARNALAALARLQRAGAPFCAPVAGLRTFATGTAAAFAKPEGVVHTEEAPKVVQATSVREIWPDCARQPSFQLTASTKVFS